MGILELKYKIHPQIEISEEKLLIKIAALLEINTTICYDSKGNPLSYEQYNDLINIGIEDINKGNFVCQEDLEKEIQSWNND